MNRLKSGRLLVLILSLSALCSCVVTKAEGEQMSSDIARLKNVIATLQRDNSDFTILVEKKQSELQSRVSELENVTFKKATHEDAESNQLKSELEQLRGQLEETQKNFEELKSTAPEVGPKAPPLSDADKNPPADKKGHFEWAKQALTDKSYYSALLRADAYIEKYKDDQQFGAQVFLIKGDAAVMLAKNAPTDAAKKDLYKKAVVSYQELLTRYPKSTKIPEALFKVGETLEAMGFAADAKIFYEEVTVKHPKSPFAKNAKLKLTSLPKKKK